MTETIPTKPGFYFAAWEGDDWVPVEVFDDCGMLRALMFGSEDDFALKAFTWGPRITMPEDLAVEEAGR